MNDLKELLGTIRQTDTFKYQGRVTRVVGMMVEGILPNACIGETCSMHPNNQAPVLAEIVGLANGRALMMPLGTSQGLTVGTPITRTYGDHQLKIGTGVLGRVLDGLGRPIDGLGDLEDVVTVLPPRHTMNPLRRRPITKTLDLGVRAINGLLTVGEGQRIAIVAGAGVGKSTLLGMMARNTDADVAVVALVGERGREVQEFVESDLQMGHAGAQHVCVIAATGDESPAMRLRAAFTANAIAEHFRDKGLRVLFLMDSLTRVVMAQREIGLSVGEPPATRGYPPSAFAVIPKLLERAGMGETGSVTAIYTTLVEGDDPDDPVGDAVRGTTDGHIVLSRKLAQSGQYPAIDITDSISRLMRNIVPPEHFTVAQKFRQALVDLQSADELVSLGAYRKGANPRYDAALLMAPKLRGFLSQSPEEVVALATSVKSLEETMQVSTGPVSGQFRREPSRSFAPLSEEGFRREASRSYTALGKQDGK
jgi:flagellum-specific ATP synthase